MQTNINNLTFLELWEEYNKYMNLKLKAQSYRKQLHIYITHIVPYFKKYLVKDINASIYLDWMTKIEKKNYKNSYNKSLHEAMVSILNYAVKFYDLEKNVASIFGGFNKKRNERKNTDYWSLEEYEKFFSVIDDDLYKLLFNILYFTGLRIGECLALTWNDFNNNSLDINKTIAKEKDENGNYIINSPKTESSYRKITLDNQIIVELKKLHAKQKEKTFYNDSCFIFGGTKPLSQSTVTRKKNKYCELADIKKIRLHDFRHSHATLLHTNGIPITVISQRLGHSNISTTLDIYTHLVNKDDEKAIDLINYIKSSNSNLFN